MGVTKAGDNKIPVFAWVRKADYKRENLGDQFGHILAEDIAPGRIMKLGIGDQILDGTLFLVGSTLHNVPSGSNWIICGPGFIMARIGEAENLRGNPIVGGKGAIKSEKN